MLMVNNFHQAVAEVEHNMEDQELSPFYNQVIMELREEIGRLNVELALSLAREKLLLVRVEQLEAKLKETEKKEGGKKDGKS